jgi:hypothetical protein
MISNVLAKLCMAFVFVNTAAMLSKLQLNEEQIKGFVFGILTSGVMAFIWTRLSGWARSGGRPGQQQTITLHTDETPAQISRAAIKSFFLLLLLFVGLLLVSALALGIALNVDLIDVLQSILNP